MTRFVKVKHPELGEAEVPVSAIAIWRDKGFVPVGEETEENPPLPQDPAADSAQNEQTGVVESKKSKPKAKES